VHHRVVGAATAEDAAVDFRMQGFDAPGHDFGEGGVLADVFDGNAGIAQRLRRIEFYGRRGFGRCGKFFNYAGLSFEILAKPPLSAPQQGFDVASFVKFIGAGNKFRFKITDAPLYKN